MCVVPWALISDMCNLVISRPKIESHLPQRPNFCTQEMLQLRHMKMTETLQKGDREAYLFQLLIGVFFFSITCIANLPHNLVPDIGNLSTTPHTHWFSAMTAFVLHPKHTDNCSLRFIPQTNGSRQLQPLLYSAQKLVSGNDSLGSISHKLVTCNNCQFNLTVLTILRPKVDNFLTDWALSFL